MTRPSAVCSVCGERIVEIDTFRGARWVHVEKPRGKPWRHDARPVE